MQKPNSIKNQRQRFVIEQRTICDDRTPTTATLVKGAKVATSGSMTSTRI